MLNSAGRPWVVLSGDTFLVSKYMYVCVCVGCRENEVFEDPVVQEEKEEEEQESGKFTLSFFPPPFIMTLCCCVYSIECSGQCVSSLQCMVFIGCMLCLWSFILIMRGSHDSI